MARTTRSYIIFHRTDPTTTVLLFLHKKNLRIHARPLIHYVRLVVTDDIPMKLSSRSPTNFLDRRLMNWHFLNMARNWTNGHVWSSVKTSCCAGGRPRRRTMLNTWSVWMGGEWDLLSRQQNLVSRRKLNVKFTSSRTFSHGSGVIIASRDEGACRVNTTVCCV